MYTDLLAATERLPFVKLLVHMAMADGAIAPEELVVIEQAATDLQVDFSPVFDIGTDYTSDLSSILAAFTSPQSKQVVLLELVSLSHADEHYSAEEREQVGVIAGMMGVAKARLEAVEAWVAEGVAWRKRGRELVQTA
ncbi:MAG: hypothetical protein AB7E47_06700 [Desulfovibrionaceae bacterium]